MTELSATSAEPAYLQRMALKHLPFSNVMPSNAFYDGSHIKQRRLLLQHLLRATRRPVWLHAASGTGKTTLVTQLQRNASTDLRFCSFPAIEDEQRCSQHALEQLGADSHTASSETELQHYLKQLRRLNITPVLLVDDFESVSELARQRLATWLDWRDEDEELLWQAVVCSQTTRQLKEIDFQTLDVPPLELGEIAAYLGQRLSAAGYQDELPFNDSTIRRFYRFSAGNPAKLNQLAHQQLLEPVRQRQWSFQLPGFVQHIGRWSAAVLVLFVILAVLIYQQDINQWIASQSVPQEEELSLPEAYEPSEVATVIAGHEQSEHSDSRQELAELLAEIPGKPAIDESEAEQVETSVEDVASEALPEPEPISQKPGSAMDEPILPLSHEQTVIPDTVVEQHNDSAWILQQKADNYTFQLMGSWETAEVDEFIEKNALSGDYARFTSLRDGKPWHVLIFGVYESKKAALNASNQWPAPMNTLPTWLRPFDSVQNQIKEKGVTP